MLFFVLLAIGLFIAIIGGIVIHSGLIAVGVTVIAAGIIGIIGVLYFYHQAGQLKRNLDKCDPGCDCSSNRGNSDCGPLDWLLALECANILTDCHTPNCELPDCDMPDCDC